MVFDGKKQVVGYLRILRSNVQRTMQSLQPEKAYPVLLHKRTQKIALVHAFRFRLSEECRTLRTLIVITSQINYCVNASPIMCRSAEMGKIIMNANLIIYVYDTDGI